MNSPAGTAALSACSSVSRPRSSTRRIFPEIVLGSAANSRRRIRLYGARLSRANSRIARAVSSVGLVAGGEHHVRLRDGEAHRVRRRHDGGLGHGRVLDQDALQLERADPVVRGLEHVVGAPDVGDVAVRVAGADVTGVVVATGHGLGVALLVAVVADHQPERALRQVHADLALVRHLPGGGVDQGDRVAGDRAAHRAGLHGLPGRVADLHGGLGLAEAVPDAQTPRLLDLLDHLGVERLPRPDDLRAAASPARTGRPG